MNHRVKEIQIFDAKSYLGNGVFNELKNLSLFTSAKPFLESIQKLCPDTLSEDGKLK